MTIIKIDASKMPHHVRGFRSGVWALTINGAPHSAYASISASISIEEMEEKFARLYDAGQLTRLIFGTT